MPDPNPQPYDSGPLVERLSPAGWLGDRAPLYAALLTGAAHDVAAGGVTARVFAGLEGPPGSVPGLRLMAALHRLVISRQVPELALHYPSVGGTAAPAGAWAPARRVIEERTDELRELVARPVQTNEVGRSAVLLTGLLHIAARTGAPLRLLEIGASGGLNLNVDRYRYTAGGSGYGPPDAPLTLVEPWDGPTADLTADLRIVERLGCDPAPVDPTTPEGRLTLSSCVWADHVERFQRLAAAFTVAAAYPVRVDKARALDWLRDRLAAPPVGPGTTVVWHSVMLQYVDPAERVALDRLLAGADVVRLSMEPAAQDPGRFPLRLRWPDGAVEHVADALGHGPPITLRPARPTP